VHWTGSGSIGCKATTHKPHFGVIHPKYNRSSPLISLPIKSDCGSMRAASQGDVLAVNLQKQSCLSQIRTGPADVETRGPCASVQICRDLQALQKTVRLYLVFFEAWRLVFPAPMRLQALCSFLRHVLHPSCSVTSCEWTATFTDLPPSTVALSPGRVAQDEDIRKVATSRLPACCYVLWCSKTLTASQEQCTYSKLAPGWRKKVREWAESFASRFLKPKRERLFADCAPSPR